MLKYILIPLLTISVYAHEPEHNNPHRGLRPHLTEQQKQLRGDIIKKYDVDKDGKLNPKERSKISVGDKNKLKKAGLPPHKPRHNGPPPHRGV